MPEMRRSAPPGQAPEKEGDLSGRGTWVPAPGVEAPLTPTDSRPASATAVGPKDRDVRTSSPPGGVSPNYRDTLLRATKDDFPGRGHAGHRIPLDLELREGPRRYD